MTEDFESVGTIICDLDQKILHIDERYAEIVSRERETLIGKSALLPGEPGELLEACIMSEADQAYYKRRAYQEQVHVQLAARPEAKAVHQQLRDLNLVRAGEPIADASFTVHAHDDA